MRSVKIEFKDLVFYARHGLLAEEAKLGQRFRVDVVVQIDPSLNISQDSIGSGLNYVDLFNTVREVFSTKRFNMIEACADAVCEGILERFDRVFSVTVKVKKPSVPVDCICDYFAAEVTQSR